MICHSRIPTHLSVMRMSPGYSLRQNPALPRPHARSRCSPTSTLGSVSWWRVLGKNRGNPLQPQSCNIILQISYSAIRDSKRQLTPKTLISRGFFRINSCLQLSCHVRNKDCPAYIGRRSLFSCPAYIDGGSSFSRPTSKHEVGPYPLWHQTDRLPHVCARDYIIIEGTLFVAVTKNKLQKTLNQI